MSASEILGTIWKLLSLDFHSFKAVFPHTWLALFIIIRVLPWFAFIPLWPGFLKLFNKSGNLLNTLWSGILRLFGKLYILLKNRSVFIFSIVLAWFLLRILFLSTPLVPNFEGDAASRIEL